MTLSIRRDCSTFVLTLKVEVRTRMCLSEGALGDPQLLRDPDQNSACSVRRSGVTLCLYHGQNHHPGQLARVRGILHLVHVPHRFDQLVRSWGSRFLFHCLWIRNLGQIHFLLGPTRASGLDSPFDPSF